MAALGAALGGYYGGVARDWRTGAPIISVYDTNRLLPGGAELLTRGLASAADPPSLFRACVESDLDTRMVLVLPTTMMGEEMREVFEKAHLRNFPEHGKVACSKLMIMAHGYWYTFNHGPVGAAIQGTDARFKIELVSESRVFRSDKPQQQENIDQQSRLPEEPEKKELVLEKENIDQRPEKPQKKVLILEKGQQESIGQRSRFPEEELVVEKGQQENIDQRFRLPEDPQKELVLKKGEEPQQQENIDQGRRSGSRLPQITSLVGTAIEDNNITDPVHNLENERELATASAVRKDEPTSKDESQNGMLNQKQMPVLSSNEEIGRVVSTSGQELSAYPVAGEEVKMINEQAKEKAGPEKQERSGADAMLAMLVKPYETRKGKAPAIDLSGQGVNEIEPAGKTTTSEKQKMLVKHSELKKGKAPEVEQAIKENTMPDAASSGADTVLENPSETIKRKAPEAHVEVEKVKKLKVDISDHGKTVEEVECEIGVTRIPEQVETKEKNTVDSVNHIEGSVGEEKAVKTNATPTTDEKVKKLKVDISDHGKTVEEVECEVGVTNASEGIPEQTKTKEKNTVNHIEGPAGEEKAVKANATLSTDEKESDSTTNSGASTGAMDSEINKDLDDIMANLMTQHFPPASPSVDRNIPSSTAFGSGESDSESSNDRDDHDEVVKKAGDMETSEASIEKAAKKIFTEAEMPQERSGEAAKDESKAQKKKLLPTDSGSTTEESDASIKNRAAPQDGQNPSGGSSAECSESSSADESESTVSEKWKKTASTVPRSRRNSTAVAPASVPVRNPRRNSIDSRFEHFIENKNGLEELLNLRMQKRVPSPADVLNDSPSVDVVLETQEIEGGKTVCKQVGSSEQGSEGKSDREEPKVAKKRKGGEQEKQRVENMVNNKENDLEAKNSMVEECAEGHQKIITKEKQDVPVKEIASTENEEARKRPDKTGKRSRVKRIATRDMIQASTETSDYASSEDESRKRQKKSGGSSKSKSTKSAQSNSNLEPKATRSEIKKAETMKATETSEEDSDSSRKRRKKSGGSSKSKSSKPAQSTTRSETKKAETTKATPSTGKAAKVSGGEISCPGCGKVYARKTSAYYSHKKACTGNS